VVVYCEASLDGLVVLMLDPAFFNAVVAGDDDSLRAEFDGSSFDFGGERVLVCPLFEVVPANLFWCQLFDDDCFLAGVTVPPFGIGLEVCVWVLVAYCVGLSRAGRSPVPFMFESFERRVVYLGMVLLVCFVELWQPFQWDKSLIDAGLGAFGEEHLVSLGGIAFDVLGGRWHAV